MTMADRPAVINELAGPGKPTPAARLHYPTTKPAAAERDNRDRLSSLSNVVYFETRNLTSFARR